MKNCRLYNDLSWLWPMWGSLDDYRVESDTIAQLIKQHALIEVETFLDVGCGGGKNLFHFKRHFKSYGLDLSENMLTLARKLNPDSEFYLGDMRSFDLGKSFNAIYLNDALPHLTMIDDLKYTFECAYKHLNPGGVMVLIPEFTKEYFINNHIEITYAAPEMKPDGLEVSFIENYYDPDPSDDTFMTTILYLIREEGVLRIERDEWIFGLFRFPDWLKILKEAGFDVIIKENEEGLEGYNVLVCVKSL